MTHDRSRGLLAYRAFKFLSLVGSELHETVPMHTKMAAREQLHKLLSARGQDVHANATDTALDAGQAAVPQPDEGRLRLACSSASRFQQLEEKF